MRPTHPKVGIVEHRVGLYTRNDPEWERNMPKKKNLDLGSARAPDFGDAIFFFFFEWYGAYLCQKNK